MESKKKEKLRKLFRKIAVGSVTVFSSIGLASSIDEMTGSNVASVIFEVVKVVVSTLFS